MDWSQILSFKMICSVLMLTSSFTLATKSIGKWSKISAFMIADFISVFIIEVVNKHVINCSRSVSRNLCWFVNCGNYYAAKHQTFETSKLWTFLLFWKPRRFILESPVIRTCFLHTSCLKRRSCKCLSAQS